MPAYDAFSEAPISDFINHEKYVSVDDSLTFTEVLINSPSVRDTLSLTEKAVVVYGVGENFPFTETVTVIFGLQETLVLTEEVEQLANKFINDALALSEIVGLTRIFTVSDTLSLSDLAARVREVSVSSTLTFTETVIKLAPQIVDDTLVLSDSAVKLEFRPASDILSLTENLSSSGTIHNGIVVDTLSLSENVVTTLIKECYDTYDPSIGIRSYITLSYPYTAPTYTVNLRNPEFGNRHALTTRQYQHTLRGGEYKIGTPVTQFNREVLEITIIGLTETQRNELMALLIASAGDELKYTDHEGRVWRGVIINNPIELLEGMEGCNYTAHLQYEGSLV